MRPDLKTALAENRAVLSVAGPDAEQFLQDLVTNDVAQATGAQGVYAALLTPQGKFIADMILWRPSPERFVLDIAAPLADDLARRLGLYKLRSAVELALEPQLRVRLVWAEDAAATFAMDDAVAGGPDPRDPALGCRFVTQGDAAPDQATPAPFEAWDRLRIARGAPEAGLDLRPNDAYPLEYGFERLHGVDFRKGCFVGQEIVARMKHKAELKKGLYRVSLDGPAPQPGAEILSDGKPAGSIGSWRDGVALALLRFDRASGPLTVEAREIRSAERLDP